MARGLVDSVHPLVQNVVLLNSVYLLPIRLWVFVGLFRPSVVSRRTRFLVAPLCSLQN